MPGREEQIMKRLFCALLCVLMILGALPAVADKPVSEVMVVVKCSEWVSLRKEPFTSS